MIKNPPDVRSAQLAGSGMNYSKQTLSSHHSAAVSWGGFVLF